MLVQTVTLNCGCCDCLLHYCATLRCATKLEPIESDVIIICQSLPNVCALGREPCFSGHCSNTLVLVVSEEDINLVQRGWW